MIANSTASTAGIPRVFPSPRPGDSRNPDLRRAARCLARAFECFHRGELLDAKRGMVDAREAINRMLSEEIAERRDAEWKREAARIDSERDLIESFCPMSEK